MKRKVIELPVLAAVAATRGMLGFGAGLLVSGRIRGKRRSRIGWTLVGIGAASTVPLAWHVLRRD